MTEEAKITVAAAKRSPNDFLKQVLGRPVVVKLNSGVEYRGILACLDGFMNIAMEQTEEYEDGHLKARYGDCFIRGNNAPPKRGDSVAMSVKVPSLRSLFSCAIDPVAHYSVVWLILMGDTMSGTEWSFVKYHGLGNDFIMIDHRHTEALMISHQQSAALCDRRRGVGADGVIFALPGSNGCKYTMKMHNADGSEAEMCGNGIRCLALFLKDLEKLESEEDITFDIWTLAGRMVVQIDLHGMITVDMGTPKLNPWSKKTDIFIDSCCSFPTHLCHGEYAVTDVSMGNPHAVVFVPRLEAFLPIFENEGRALSEHNIFPDGANAEFVQVHSRQHIELVVWERGSGRTLACGTGACAAVVAAVVRGYVDRTCRVTLPGGDLDIHWKNEDSHVYMKGPAVEVFRGSLKIQ